MNGPRSREHLLTTIAAVLHTHAMLDELDESERQVVVVAARAVAEHRVDFAQVTSCLNAGAGRESLALLMDYLESPGTSLSA